MRGSGSLGGDWLSTRRPRRGLLPPGARGAQPGPPLALSSRARLSVGPSPGAAPRFPAAPGPAWRSPPALRPCPPRARGPRGLGTRSPQSLLLVARSFPGFPCEDRSSCVCGPTCGQEVTKSWNSLRSLGKGVKAGPESLLLLRSSPVSLKAALLGGHAGRRETGQGKCPTLPPPSAGLGRHFPGRTKDPTQPPAPGRGWELALREGTELVDRPPGLNLWRRCSFYPHTHPSSVTASRFPRSGLRSALLSAPPA